jgi:uncharacterized membrane protein
MDALLFTLLVSFFLLTQGYALVFNVVLIGAIIFYWVGAIWAARLGANAQKLKYLSIALVVCVVLAFGTINVVLERYGTAPYLFAHDGLIQSEEATRMILEGKNPYVENYVDTPMALWDFQIGDFTVNPALHHYPYMPFTFLVAVPIQILLPLRFDQRILYVGFFLMTLVFAHKFTSQPRKKLLLLVGMSLNPLLVPFMVRHGRNDVLVLCFILLTLYFLSRERWLASAMMLALASATKQFAWFFIPFYFLYVGQRGIFKASVFTFVIVFGAIVLPFVLWQPVAFYEDIIVFQSGMAAHSYPINGFGFSMSLLSSDLISSHTSPFPFWIFQLVLGLPLMLVLLRHQLTNNTFRQAVFNYTMLFFVISFFSRAFNDNYIGFLLSLILLVWLMDNPPYSEGKLAYAS